MSEENATVTENTTVTETVETQLTDIEQATQILEQGDKEPEPDNVEPETETEAEPEPDKVEPETEAESKERISSAWVKLNRREKELQKQSDQLKQQVQFVQQNFPIVQQAQELIKLSKDNPRDFLIKSGVSIEDFTNGLLEDPPPSSEAKELKQLKQQLNEMQQQAQLQAQRQELANQYYKLYSEHQNYLASNIDMYPNIKSQNAQGVVWETRVHAANQGEKLTHEQACQMVDKYLETHQITASGEVIKKPEPKPELPATEDKPATKPKVSKTISNNLESQPAIKSESLTEDERMAEAIRALGSE